MRDSVLKNSKINYISKDKNNIIDFLFPNQLIVVNRETSFIVGSLAAIRNTRLNYFFLVYKIYHS